MERDDLIMSRNNPIFKKKIDVSENIQKDLIMPIPFQKENKGIFEPPNTLGETDFSQI